MENQNKVIMDINEKPYGREGIEEMIERLNSLDDKEPKGDEKDKGIA